MGFTTITFNSLYWVLADGWGPDPSVSGPFQFPILGSFVFYHFVECTWNVFQFPILGSTETVTGQILKTVSFQFPILGSKEDLYL